MQSVHHEDWATAQFASSGESQGSGWRNTARAATRTPNNITQAVPSAISTPNITNLLPEVRQMIWERYLADYSKIVIDSNQYGRKTTKGGAYSSMRLQS
jgi:hypothetical protein